MITFAVIFVLLSYLGFRYVQELSSEATTGQAKAHKVFQDIGTSFDVAWINSTPSSGELLYKPCPFNEGEQGNDGTNVRGGDYEGVTQMFQASGVNPGTKYCYKIRFDNNKVSSVYEYTTLPSQSTGSTPDTPTPIFGSVNSDFSEKLISLTLIKKISGEVVSKPLGSPVSEDASWSMTLTNLRDLEGNKININNLNEYLYFFEISDINNEPLASEVVDTTASLDDEVALENTSVVSPRTEAAKYGESTTRDDDENSTPPNNQSPDPAPDPGGGSNNNDVSIIFGPEIVNHNPAGDTFGVLWETRLPTNSYVEYTVNGSETFTAFDPRAGNDVGRSLRTHYVEIKYSRDEGDEADEFIITPVNNNVRAQSLQYTRSISDAQAPLPNSTPVNFSKEGNYIDQVLILEVPGQSTKIVAVPSNNGTSIIQWSNAALADDPSQSYDFRSDSNISIDLIGGDLKSQSSYSYGEMSDPSFALQIESEPKDDSGFSVKYINLVEGQVFNTTRPEFTGEGVDTLNLRIERK